MAKRARLAGVLLLGTLPLLVGLWIVFGSNNPGQSDRHEANTLQLERATGEAHAPPSELLPTAAGTEPILEPTAGRTPEAALYEWNISRTVASSPLASRDLHVTVIDDGGMPVASAIIELWAGSSLDRAQLTTERLNESPLATFETGVDGCANLVLPAEPGALSARKVGVGTSGRFSAPLIGRPAGPLAPCTHAIAMARKLVVLNKQARVTGRVITALGSSVPAATVDFEARPVSGSDSVIPESPTPVISDQSGAFCVEADAPAVLRIDAVTADGLEASTIVRVEPSVTAAVTLTVRPSCAYELTAVVIGPQGDTISGCGVRVWSERCGAVSGSSDEGGVFSVCLPCPGAYSIAVNAPGYVQAEPVSVVLDEWSPRAVINVPLAAAGSIRGRVSWESGDGVADASIELLPSAPAGEASWLGFAWELQEIVRSAADGTFECTSVHPELRYTLTAVDSEAEASVKVSGVTAGDDDIHCILPAPSGMAQNGAVVLSVIYAASGNPVERFSVACGGWSWLESARVRQVESSNGMVRLERLRRGVEYGLIVRAAGFPEIRAGPFDIGLEERHMTVAIGDGTRVVVSVVDEHNDPVAAAHVMLVKVIGEKNKQYILHDKARSSDEGQAAFEGCQRGQYVVMATGGDMQSSPEIVVIRDEEPIELRVEMHDVRLRGRIEIAVRTEAQPVSGAQAVVQRLIDPDRMGAGGEYAGMGETDEMGMAVIHDVIPGIYVVRLVVWNYVTHETQVVVSRDGCAFVSWQL